MKKILVTQSSMPSLEEYVEEIKDMWDTHWLTNMGPKHKKFQEELKQYLGVENIDLMTNGHMALNYLIYSFLSPFVSPIYFILFCIITYFSHNYNSYPILSIHR